MSEETRHKFNRLTFYTMVFAFLSVSMTFVIFSSVAQVSLSCPSGQFINFIGTTNDSCGKPLVEHGSNSCTIPATGVPRCIIVTTFPTAFTSIPQMSVTSRTGSALISIISGILYLFKIVPSATAADAIWPNFPTSAQCPFTIQSSLTVPDSCEFQATNTSRAVLLNPGLYLPSVSLKVDCRTPSNTAGAFLGLQVANYSSTSQTNSSNFVDAFGGHQVAWIDNAMHTGLHINFPCPGIVGTDNGALVSPLPPAPAGWVFRVFGSGGGGAGDNPVFGDVTVQVTTAVNRLVQTSPTTITTTTFTTQVSMLTNPQFATTVTFDWIATNTP